MKTRKFIDFEATANGFGTWRMGGGHDPDHSKDVEETNVMKYWLSKGINFIDTAEMYGGGHTEEMVSNAISEYERNKIFITSKVWPSNFKNVEKAIQGSLKRLKTDYVDLYLIHWPDDSVNHRDLIKQMVYIKEQGYARNIGVSNYDLKRLKEAWELSEGTIKANQIQINIEKTDTFNEIKSFCKTNGIEIIAYSPLNKNKMPSDPEISKKIKQSGLSPAIYSLLYTLDLGVYPIPKASTREHVDEIIAAVEKHLDK
ncbi:aldo/keto reductase [Caldiplasma sukawensis]